MRTTTILAFGIFATSLSFGHSLAAQEVSAEELIADYTFYNGICRGGSGADVSTWQACGARNYVHYRLNVLGVCHGKEDEEIFENEWHKCSSGSFRDNSRPDPRTDQEISTNTSEPAQPDFKAAFERLPSESRKHIQGSLSTVGYYNGKLDGAWGPMTERAILSMHSRFSHIGSDYAGKKTLEDSFLAFILGGEYLPEG